MSELIFYADGDSVTFQTTLTNLDGQTVDADSITCEVRQAKGIDQRFWDAGSVVQAPTNMTNFAVGVYRYNWSTATFDAGAYVAEVKVVRGAITNRERIPLTLK